MVLRKVHRYGRKALTLLLLMTMILSLFNITTIGFAARNEREGDLCIAQAPAGTDATYQYSDTMIAAGSNQNFLVRLKVAAKSDGSGGTGDGSGESGTQTGDVQSATITVQIPRGTTPVSQSVSAKFVDESGSTVNTVTFTQRDYDATSGHIVFSTDNAPASGGYIEGNFTLNIPTNASSGTVYTTKATAIVDGKNVPDSEGVEINSSIPVYYTQKATVSLSGSNTYTMQDGDFSVTADTYYADGSVSTQESMTVPVNSKGEATLNLVFPAIAGEYYSIIKQGHSNLAANEKNNISLDNASYRLDVKIEKMGSEFRPTATVTKEGTGAVNAISFRNTVASEPTKDSVVFRGMSGKVTSTSTAKEGEFTFILEAGACQYDSGVAKASMEADENQIAAFSDDEELDEGNAEDNTDETDIQRSDYQSEEIFKNPEFFYNRTTVGPTGDFIENYQADVISDDNNNASTSEYSEESNIVEDDSNSASNDVVTYSLDNSASTEEDNSDDTVVDDKVESDESEEGSSGVVSHSVEDIDTEDDDASTEAEQKTEERYEGSADENLETVDNEEPAAITMGVSPMPSGSESIIVDGKEKSIKRATANTSGAFDFGDITFTDVGKYNYTMYQDIPESKKAGYDNSIYNITVDVSRDSSNALKAVAAMSKVVNNNGQTTSVPVTSMNFENTSTTNAPALSFDLYQQTTGYDKETKNTITVKNGNEIVYYLVITNKGAVDLKDVKMTDVIPTTLTYVENSVTGGGVYSSSSRANITWAIGDIPVGNSALATFKVKVPNVTQPTRWENTAYLTYANNPDNVINKQKEVYSNTVAATNRDTNNGSASSEGLEVLITQARNKENAGTGELRVYPKDTITYNIVVSNKGENNLTNINVEDSLPSGLAVQESSISSGGTIQRSKVLWNIGNLTPGASTSLNFVVEVPDVTKPTTYENTVQAYPQTNTTAMAISNVLKASVVPTAATSEFTVEMKQSKTNNKDATDKDIDVGAGDVITYYITVYNNGDNESTEITVTDEIPKGLELVSTSISDGGSSLNRVLTWKIPSLAADRNKTVSFQVKVPANASGSWTNSAKVTLANVSNNTLESNKVIAKVGTGITIEQTQSVRGSSESKQDERVTKDDRVTYTFTVKNTGSSIAEGVVVTDSVPAGLTVDTTTIKNGGRILGNVVTWNLGNIQPGNSKTVSVTATVPEASTNTKWTNTGNLRYDNNPDGKDTQIPSNPVTIIYHNPDETVEPVTEPEPPVDTGTMDPGEGTGNYTEVTPAPVGEKIPQTGGQTPMDLWIFLLVMSGGGLILMALTNKKVRRA